MVSTLIIRFHILTPLYLGGAEQQADLRAPSIKGLLRFWYRAMDPSFAERMEVEREDYQELLPCTREDHFFGGVRGAARQSPFLLRVASEALRPFVWEPQRFSAFNTGGGNGSRNGLTYLGFPFHMLAQQKERDGGSPPRSGESRGKRASQPNADKGQGRTAFAPQQAFTVRCVFPRQPDVQLRRSVLASFWLLGHLGSLGSRGRRGFGSVMLREWGMEEGEPFPELDELRPLTGLSKIEDWEPGLERALARFRTWFPDSGSAQRQASEPLKHPHLGEKFRWVLMPDGLEGWQRALDHAGTKLQEFRQRKSPDYEDVKGHILAESKQGSRFLRATPERATFGLPLTFRYRSVPEGRPVTFVPWTEDTRNPLERHGSLLHLRLVEIGKRLHPLFFRLDGAVPGMDPPAVIRGQPRPLQRPMSNAMDGFLDWLKRG